ncbi:MAG: hypothetical protein HOK63_00230 [Thaumarchaeota archaeon]|jgi:hypothetical protein|nr:hypothetical protein [Nitrososphaerota archaeon]
MKTELSSVLVFSLIVFMIIPVHADVDFATIEPETFSIDDKFTISGTISDAEKMLLTSVIRGPNGEKPDNKNTFSSDGEFSFIPIDALNVFVSKGEYTVTVFTDKQNFANATVIKVYYEKGIATLLPDYELILKDIGNKNVDETKELSFTVGITDSSIENLEYSLSGAPNGSKIDKDTGVFTWIPTNSQSGNYILEVVVKSGILEDKETISITVNDKPEQITEPEPEPISETTQELASFVDETKDPQSYVDRYNNEASYKKWFDDNYSEYSSIYQAVGLDDPKDKTIQEPVIEEPEFGECGEGTRLVEGICSILEEPEFGECGEGTKLVKKTCTVIENIKVKPWWQFW